MILSPSECFLIRSGQQGPTKLQPSSHHHHHIPLNSQQRTKLCGRRVVSL
uniref:Uncharacterized protein n=1 Tax=Anguilla anguilla TaxID=7936 RepID=A0A0E9RTQ8_ANGAN